MTRKFRITELTDEEIARIDVPDESNPTEHPTEMPRMVEDGPSDRNVDDDDEEDDEDEAGSASDR